MARDLEKLSYAQLLETERELQRLKGEKQIAERAAVKEKLTAEARKAGFEIGELFGSGRKGGGKGSVAPKYRDPKNVANTWTGRGRMPRWMVAATKGSKAKKDDFLIK